MSLLYAAAEKGEEKKKKERRKKKERTRVKTMVSQVAMHSARNSPVPISYIQLQNEKHDFIKCNYSKIILQPFGVLSLKETALLI